MKSLRFYLPALLGWFLLTPPLARNGGFESYAPLSRWTEAAQFGSQPECENYRHHVASAGLARDGQSGAIDREAEAKLRLRGICVSSEERKLENE